MITSMNHDPLKILYLLVMDDGSSEDMSPFQGFGAGWHYLHWAMRLLPHLPSDVTERSHSLEAIAYQRIAGLRPLFWAPLNISALEKASADIFPPCTVAFSGTANVSNRVEALLESGAREVFHLGFDKAVSLSDEDILKELSEFCFRQLSKYSRSLNDDQKGLVDTLSRDWRRDEVEFKALDIQSHNVSLPNYMALQRIGFKLDEGKPFIGTNEEEYTDLIMETASAVRFVRQECRENSERIPEQPTPNLILFEPALFRHMYKNGRPTSATHAEINRALKVFQKQKGLCRHISQEEFERMFSASASVVSGIRSGELVTQTLGVGLYASTTSSPVLRLSPSVNHVHNKLSFFARNVRSAKPEAKRKARRLFKEIQDGLASGIGPKRLEAISKTSGPIKIVSDAPIEWLPLSGDVPLSMVKDCSRIPVTPGNLMMAQLVPSQPMTISPKSVSDILVISSFTDDDPLRFMLRNALDHYKHLWGDDLNVKQVFVSSAQEFEEALNAFDGSVLVFDGHGASNDSVPVGTILLAREKVDVWNFRGRVRCPPIVILSACDTQGIDASTHATVGNGFLALGATSVVGTFLPVGGFASAVFVARLMHRLAAYIPAMLKSIDQPLSWLEVISGMLRMSAATEIINDLCGIDGAVKVRENANFDINSRREDWFERLVDNLTVEADGGGKSIRKRALESLAQSDAIRYTHLGNPEKICFFE